MSSNISSTHNQTASGSLRIIVLLTMAIGFTAGCGGGGGGGGVSAASTSQPTQPTQPTGSAELTVSPASLDFSKVVIGQTAQRTVTLTNTGTLELTNVTLSSPVEGYSAAGPCSSVDVGSECEIVVEFTPLEQQAYGGSFNIDSNAPTVPVSVTGEGQGYNVEISSITNTCVDPIATIQVTVSDADNNPVTLLSANHFTPVLDGNEVSLDNFAILTEDEPVSVALAADWSSSLSGFRSTIAETAGIFIDTLNADDTAGVYRFAAAVDGNKQDFVAADAAGKDILKDALYLGFIGNQDSSSIWNSTEAARAQTALETNTNRAVVLLTDGDNTDATGTSLEQLIDNAVADDINIYTLGFGNVVPAPLVMLAQETGGLYFEDPLLENLVEIYEKVLASLSNRYEFTIQLPNPGVESQLTIVVEDDLGTMGDDTRVIAACP